ncbi:hypothetical protein [Leyella stercorea]|uniref:hypothetical protein n=1 Tax=Leyella stercorea TaxID=363265 RepID=UPI00266CBCD7|nr:hypothetical protein [Leyella stercorea]
MHLVDCDIITPCAAISLHLVAAWVWQDAIPSYTNVTISTSQHLNISTSQHLNSP